MHEDLLGYLLGALEPHEMCHVENMLKEDPVLREQLAELEQALIPLEHHVEPAIDPVPSDLVSRTMAGIPSGTSDQARSDRTSQSTFDSLIPLQGAIEIGKNSHASLIDWIGGLAAAAAILGLLLPSLAEGRFEARRVACQAQLRQLGTAITQFVNRDQQQRLPAVTESGPEAFAGVYSVRLIEAGLLPDQSLRWCPSLAIPSKSAVTLTPITVVESVADLHRASPDTLRQIQQYAGGHRAYTLGVVDGQRLKSPRFESRASFAVMSDAPQAGFANREDIGRLTGHGGEGINVLYEDGRVKFIAISALNAMPDHPLLNNRGRAEAGVNIDDASLAPSWVAPFFNAVQR